MKTWKLTKLFPPPNIQLRKYFKFEGDSAPLFLLLPRCITELSSMRSYDNLARTDVTFTSCEMEEVKASASIAWGCLVDGLVALICLDSCYGQPDRWGEVLLTFPNGPLTFQFRFLYFASSQLPRSSPTYSLWCQSGLRGEGFGCYAIWTTGLLYWSWSLAC